MDWNLLIWCLLCLVIAPIISQKDVCANYNTLNSTKLRTDNTIPSRALTLHLDWYRYTGTTSGVIATSCPTQRNACGATHQIWIEGPLPIFGSGIKQVPSCVKTDRDGVRNCCGMRSTLDIANCNGFFVYHLRQTAPDSNYCFNATAPALSTVTMPQTTRINSSQDTTTSGTTLPLTTTIDTSQDTTTTGTTLPLTTTIDTSQDITTTRTLMPLTTTIHTSQETTLTSTTLPLTAQASNNTTTVQSTITFLQTTSVNNTPPRTSTLKRSTATAHIQTSMNSSLNATTELTTTLTTHKLTTQFHISQSHTQHVTVTQVTYGTSTGSTRDSNSVINHTIGATTELMLSTNFNKALSSKTNQQSTEQQSLIGVVTGSVVGCVVVVLAVTAAAYHFKKFRGHQKVRQAHHDTVFEHCTPDMGIKKTKFNVQLLQLP